VDPETGDKVPTMGPTALRFREEYIRYYIMWTKLFSTCVIPVVLLFFLNARIVFDLCQPRTQRFGSDPRRQRREINLCLILLCIVLVFFLCHSARISLDAYEFSNVESVISR